MQRRSEKQTPPPCLTREGVEPPQGGGDREEVITVRIEVEPSEINSLLDAALRKKIVTGFKEIGFTYVTLDLEGYRTGSMNEALGKMRSDPL